MPPDRGNSEPAPIVFAGQRGPESKPAVDMLLRTCFSEPVLSGLRNKAWHGGRRFEVSFPPRNTAGRGLPVPVVTQLGGSACVCRALPYGPRALNRAHVHTHCPVFVQRGEV
ncbi:hypothetical protein AAFF_G00101150 [Aldrovandia affinis]|uniref:Uncharacterized protein n=1 Tax=Aldrovandia affinis TaxID=143900 RepID=A0AAD7WBQ7_9TELE|nr:hypothetical protein AAFF_G00101150 [Aldrovandia affinis]